MLEISPVSIICTLINLFVLYFLYRKFLYNRIQKTIDERQNMIKGQFDKAKRAKKKAHRLKVKYQKSLADAQAESARIIENAKARGEAEYNRIVDEAGERSRKMIADAQAAIEQERAKTMQDAQSQITELAMLAAAKIIGETTSANTDANLYNEFISKTGGANDTNSH